MAKLPITTRRINNALLDYIAAHVEVGALLPTEVRMAQIGGCSRTVVRRSLANLAERGLIAGMTERRLLRKPAPGDWFDAAELHSQTENLQQVLLEQIYRRDLPPGTSFTEAELSRAAGVSTVAVREFLIGFSRYGLIAKNPKGGWSLCAFDPDYAEELADAREMFELKSIERLAGLAADDPVFDRFGELLARHEALAGQGEAGAAGFPALDREFHTYLIGLLKNRFAEQLNDAVSLVFHYHYQWDKHDEMPRNRHALQEHLAILRALAVRDLPAAIAAMRAHLGSARTTMLASTRRRQAQE